MVVVHNGYRIIVQSNLYFLSKFVIVIQIQQHMDTNYIFNIFKVCTVQCTQLGNMALVLTQNNMLFSLDNKRDATRSQCHSLLFNQLPRIGVAYVVTHCPD